MEEARPADPPASPPAPGDRARPNRPPISVRPARLGDLATLVRLYRSQPEESRKLYHPFPFGRFRLTAIFGYMIVTRRFLRRMIRRPGVRAALLLVACVGGRRAPIGYGNVGFEHHVGHEPRAIFGYLVDPQYRGQGVGTRLHEVMIDEAIALGVTRGGGMVVTSNTANLRVLQKLGFEPKASDVVDRTVPGESNLVTDADLVELSMRIHATSARGGRPMAGR